MERDRQVAVVTDTGTSMRPDSPEVQKLGITVVPLEVNLWEKDQFVPYSDTDISSSDFYEQMKISEKLPQTSGAIPGRLTETFRNLKEKAGSIISIHITSKHSAVWESAMLAKNIIQEEAGQKTQIEVIDTKQVSIAAWFPVEVAAKLSLKRATLTEIKNEVKEAIEKTQLYVTLQTFENLKKGGRGDEILKAVFASMLSIYPVIGLADGKLKNFAFARSVQKARERMIEMVGDAGKLVRIAVIHTNALPLAEKIKETLGKIYKGTIPVYEAGPVLAVHAGEGAVAIAYQKA